MISEDRNAIAIAGDSGGLRSSIARRQKRFRDYPTNPFRRLDKVSIRKMSVTRRGFMAAMTEQPAHQRQVLPRHDGVTCRRVAQVVEPKPAELSFLADRAPAGELSNET